MSTQYVEVQTPGFPWTRNRPLRRAGVLISLTDEAVTFNWDGSIETVSTADALSVGFYHYEPDPRRPAWQVRVDDAAVGTVHAVYRIPPVVTA